MLRIFNNWTGCADSQWCILMFHSESKCHNKISPAPPLLLSQVVVKQAFALAQTNIQKQGYVTNTNKRSISKLKLLQKAQFSHFSFWRLRHRKLIKLKCVRLHSALSTNVLVCHMESILCKFSIQWCGIHFLFSDNQPIQPLALVAHFFQSVLLTKPNLAAFFAGKQSKAI